MLNEAELTTAVDLHRRAYQLLGWIGQELRHGRIRADQLHENTDATSAAYQWVLAHYSEFPSKFRPKERRGPELKQFANLLASYLTASFDLVEETATHPDLLYKPCHCSFCQRLLSFTRLRVKKLGRMDKQRARELMREYLGRLADEQGKPLAAAQIEQMLDDPTLREKAAMATYGEQLIKRMHGDPTDPSTLALWRIFAWEPSGSPKHGFELSASDILRAEQDLAAMGK
jgi:hypothetical protein